MTAGLTKTAIATWFVADKPGEETSFPQVGGQSSSIKFQNIYWRCVACFFASSRQSNPTATHLFFTNAEIPVVDGVDLAGLFRSWQVQVIHLPLTYRLPPGVSKAWGNQLYILDIIKYMAANPRSDEIIVLDSDCVWTTTAEPISRAISKYGCLTYTLNDEHYAWDAAINGVTRQEMSDALRRWTADCDIAAPAELHNGPIQYHGGEIFAATREVCCDLSLLIDSLWHWWLEDRPRALRDKGRSAFPQHSVCAAFLSELYRESLHQADLDDFSIEQQDTIRSRSCDLARSRGEEDRVCAAVSRDNWNPARSLGRGSPAGLQQDAGGLFGYPAQICHEIFF